MDSLLKDFTHRRQVALKGDDSEVSDRLIGLLDWLESKKLAAEILKKIRKAGGVKLLGDSYAQRSYLGRKPPKAKTLEEIASVGLALVDEARNRNQGIDEFAFDRYGILSGGKKGDGPVGRYVVPFLDFIEEQLPQPASRSIPTAAPAAPPAIIHDSLNRFRKDHRDTESTCFVMMRFGKTGVHSRLEKTIKQALKKHGLVGLLARDKEFHDDLYPNIQTYIHGCAFGIAVFERLETNEFNPNVALEVGYMFGLRKQVLLLKDKTLNALHTDLVGKLYREFDPQNPEDTIPAQIDSWLTDKGLA